MSPSLKDTSQESKCFSHNSRCLGSIFRFSGHSYHRLCATVPDQNPGGLSAHSHPALCLNGRVFPTDLFQTCSHLQEIAFCELSSTIQTFPDHMLFRNNPVNVRHAETKVFSRF